MKILRTTGVHYGFGFRFGLSSCLNVLIANKCNSWLIILVVFHYCLDDFEVVYLSVDTIAVEKHFPIYVPFVGHNIVNADNFIVNFLVRSEHSN